MKHTFFLLILMCVLAQTALAGELIKTSPTAPGQYIVRFKDKLSSPAADIARRLGRDHAIRVTNVYSAVLNGFAFRGNEAAALALSRNPQVLYVQEVAIYHVSGTPQTQTPARSSGLDRIDQRFSGANNAYRYSETGAGVVIHVVDTGVGPTPELAGRIVGNWSYVPNDSAASRDCSNHGTEVATIAAGTTWGVAKNALINNMRVFDCSGSASSAELLTALNDIYLIAVGTPGHKGVANLSWISFTPDPALDDAVVRLTYAGVPVVTAAGDFYRPDRGQDPCDYSPSRMGPMTGVITVSSTNLYDEMPFFYWNADGIYDGIYRTTGTGPCVDIFAPTDVQTGDYYGREVTMTGTSASVPAVAGAVALLIERSQSTDPAAIEWGIQANATKDVILGLPLDTPNLLLHSLGRIDVTPSPSSVFASATSTASVPATAGATYAWQIQNGTILSGQGTPSVTYRAGCSGFVNFEVTVTAPSSIHSGTAAVPIKPSNSKVTGSTTITRGQSATIQATLQGTGPWTLWWTDDVTQANLTTSPALRTVTPTATKTFRTVAIRDAYGCFGTNSGFATITVR